MSDDNYNLKTGLVALSKQASERLKSKGDPHAANHLVERYNFYLNKAKELKPKNDFIQSLNPIELCNEYNDFGAKLEEVTYALIELDSQIQYELHI